jgi:hypothetical protein
VKSIELAKLAKLASLRLSGMDQILSPLQSETGISELLALERECG